MQVQVSLSVAYQPVAVEGLERIQSDGDFDFAKRKELYDIGHCRFTAFHLIVSPAEATTMAIRSHCRRVGWPARLLCS